MVDCQPQPTLLGALCIEEFIRISPFAFEGQTSLTSGKQHGLTLSLLKKERRELSYIPYISHIFNNA
jgi:hypothetical protein